MAKRSLYIFVAVGVISGVAGGVAARVRFSYRQKIRAEETDFAAKAQAKLPGIYFTSLLRGADEVRISDGVPNEKHDPRFNDPALISKISKIIGEASYEPHPQGFWISSPAVQIYCGPEHIFTLMTLDKVLRVSGPLGGGDFVVDQQTAKSIHALMRQLEAGKSVD